MAISGTEQVDAGQRIYTRALLRFYDLVAIQISCRFIWRCPVERILELYNKHVTGNHLEVGVGTGYFLDRCCFQQQSPRIALLDFSQHSLNFAGRRLVRFNPTIYCRNLLENLSLGANRFDSVGINAVLHCIPGTFETKSVILDHLKEVMNPGAVLFGSTMLCREEQQSLFAKCLMEFYNQKRVFSNRHDNLAAIETALHQRFRDVTIEVVGCAAVFTGRV